MSTYTKLLQVSIKVICYWWTKIASVEGTTQGDPLTMPSYAIGIIPMLSQLKTDLDKNEINVKHVAYEDDLGRAGKITEMLKWGNNVVNFGPLIGYYLIKFYYPKKRGCAKIKLTRKLF